jgi:hypothetical protein
LVSIFLIFFIWGSSLFSCTGITASSGNRVLVGNNEDYGYDVGDPVARIRPAAEGKYGCLLFGFYMQSFSMGGINDKGLFFDMFSIPEVEWVYDPDKLDYAGFLEAKMLEECANVGEAIEFLHTYNNEGFGIYQLLLVDKTGRAVVVGWNEDDIEVVEKEGDYFAVTNFFLLHPERGWHPCWRYTTANEMLANANEFSIDLFRSILDAVHVSVTKYSIISELRAGDMYIYNFHNFDEFIKLNIHEEIQKGWNDYRVPAYLSDITLLSPADGAAINQTGITFEWDGKPDSSYQLVYSVEPEFENAETIEAVTAMRVSIGSVNGTAMGFLFLLIPPIAVISRKRENTLIRLMILLLVIMFLVSCHTTESYDDEEAPFSITVNNLESNTIYYWKIRASAAGNVDNITSESIVRTFHTGT